MNKLSVIMVSVAVATIASCTKEIKYNGDAKDPLLVLNCITEKDSSIVVELEKSRFFLSSSNDDYSITSGAIVTLVNQTSGQSFSVSTPDGNGNYVFPVSAISGNTYTISATHPDFKSVNSQMEVLSSVPILSVDTSSYSSAEGQKIMKAQVKWNDPAGADYYIMKLSLINTAQGIENKNMPLGSNDQSMDELSASDFDGEDYFPNQLYFTDELFDGTQKTLEVKFPVFLLGPPSPDEHYKFILYRCTEATYKYLVSTQKAQNAANDFFSEPVKVFTNIENGYGIFGCLSESNFVK